MKKIIQISALSIWLLLSCKEKFTAYLGSPASGYLVVDAIISNDTGATRVILTRSLALNSSRLESETGAALQVEGEDQSLQPLQETTPGHYTAGQLNLQAGRRYRLLISTQAGQKYESSYEIFRPSPPIDSLVWFQDPAGVTIRVHSHDPADTTRYYEWNYDETWEIHSAFTSNLAYDSSGPVSNRTYSIRTKALGSASFDSSLYYCWSTQSSKSIEIGSSASLSRDVIQHDFPTIPQGSGKLLALYSILVRQYAVNKDAFLFLEKVKANTENTGSIFDAQPTELAGNIYCSSNPKEMVVGYARFSGVSSKRIFIDNNALNNWSVQSYCQQVEISNLSDSIKKAIRLGLQPTLPAHVIYDNGRPPSPIILSFYASPPPCVDCIIAGGDNLKPSFWPR